MTKFNKSHVRLRYLMLIDSLLDFFNMKDIEPSEFVDFIRNNWTPDEVLLDKAFKYLVNHNLV